MKVPKVNFISILTNFFHFWYLKGQKMISLGSFSDIFYKKTHFYTKLQKITFLLNNFLFESDGFHKIYKMNKYVSHFRQMKVSKKPVSYQFWRILSFLVFQRPKNDVFRYFFRIVLQKPPFLYKMVKIDIFTQ